MHIWVNDLALAFVVPFFGRWGYRTTGLRSRKWDSKYLGCEEALRLQIQWCNGMPQSLDRTFLSIEDHAKGIITLDLQLPHLCGVLSSILSYVKTLHTHWLGELARQRHGHHGIKRETQSYRRIDTKLDA